MKIHQNITIFVACRSLSIAAQISILCEDTHLSSYQLEEASPESNSIHRIKQEIDTEVSVEEQHAELLDTPEVRWCCRFPQRVEKKDVEAHCVAGIQFCC